MIFFSDLYLSFIINNTMKTIFPIILIIGFISFFSCSKDCTPPAIEQNIVGTWTGIAEANGQTKPRGTATFNSDHTGTSPGEILQADFNGGPKNVKDFTWAVDSVDNLLMLFYEEGTSYYLIYYEIKSNECNTVKLAFDGTIILNRN